MGRLNTRIAETYNDAIAAAGLDFALSVSATQSRAVLFVLPTTTALLRRAQALEAAAAAALGVPHGGPAAADASLHKAAGAEGEGGVDMEKGVEEVAGGGAAEVAPAGGAPRKSALKPFLANAKLLLGLGSGLAAIVTIVQGNAAALRGLPAALSSRAAFGAGASWVCGHATVALLLAHHGPLPTSACCLAAPATPTRAARSAAQPHQPVCLQVLAGPLPGHDGLHPVYLEGGGLGLCAASRAAHWAAAGVALLVCALLGCCLRRRRDRWRAPQ